jgi:tRNA (cmo5U34)-methyltransferase
VSRFDSKAAGWHTDPVHVRRAEAIAAAMERTLTLSNHPRALELGAGTGLLSFFLKDHFTDIVLTDQSEKMLDAARAHQDSFAPASVSFLQKDISGAWDAKNFGGPFDIIYAQMMLHHVADPAALIWRLPALLNHGGILAIADLYPEDGSFHNHEPDIHPGLDPSLLTAMFLTAGFTEVQHEQCHLMRKSSADGAEREYRIFLISGVLDREC